VGVLPLWGVDVGDVSVEVLEVVVTGSGVDDDAENNLEQGSFMHLRI
jgi:hypothetical protein